MHSQNFCIALLLSKTSHWQDQGLISSYVSCFLICLCLLITEVGLYHTLLLVSWASLALYPGFPPRFFNSDTTSAMPRMSQRRQLILIYSYANMQVWHLFKPQLSLNIVFDLTLSSWMSTWKLRTSIPVSTSIPVPTVCSHSFLSFPLAPFVLS